MEKNTHVKKFSLAATRSNDPIAMVRSTVGASSRLFTHDNVIFTSFLYFLFLLQAFSDMLRVNKTLRSLNLESNFITGAGVQALVDAMQDNDTVTEIKIDNQVQDAVWHTGYKWAEVSKWWGLLKPEPLLLGFTKLKVVDGRWRKCWPMLTPGGTNYKSFQQ